MAFFSRDLHTGRIAPVEAQHLVLEPVFTGMGTGMTNTFHVKSTKPVAESAEDDNNSGNTYGNYSVFPHQHFSVLGHGRAPDDPIRKALQQAGSVHTFPRGTPVTAIESIPNYGREWELASWRQHTRTGTLWHASPAETPDSVSSNISAHARSSF